MKSYFLILLLFPLLSLAAPGFYGKDVKIKAKEGKIFLIEQAGHAMKVDETKLPEDIRTLWRKNIGKTIESAIPYAAVVEDKALKNPKPLPVQDR